MNGSGRRSERGGRKECGSGIEKTARKLLK
jgi:hypothetical protein